MAERAIWARGLTKNEVGKTITIGDEAVLVRNVEHFDGRTVLTVVSTIELAHDTEVVIHE